MKSDLIHPIRFMRRFPEGKALAQALGRSIGNGALKVQDYARMSEKATETYNLEVDRLPFEFRPNDADTLFDTLSIIASIGVFISRGRNIFAIDSGLVAMLGRTDLSGVRTGDIKLPFEAFYLSFGDAFEWSLPGHPNRIDGVYVNATVGLLEMMVTCHRTAGHRKSWVLGHETYFYLPIDPRHEDRTFEEAISVAIAARDIRIEPDWDEIGELRSAAEHLRDEGYPVGTPAITAGERQAKFNREALASARRAVMLAVNAICYLTAAPDAVGAPTYPDDTPEGMTSAVALGRKSARHAAKAQMLDGGWLPIRLISSPAPSFVGVDGSEGGAARAPHWRRGHWRRQPCGSGRAEIKLTWIRPTLVRGDIGEPAAGHLYHSGVRS